MSSFCNLCIKCGGPNHAAAVCLEVRSLAPGPTSSRQPVYTLKSDETSELFIGTVHVGEIDRSWWHANLFVVNQGVCFKLDSGVDANVLPLVTYERLGSGAPLMQTNTFLTSIHTAKIRTKGGVTLRVVDRNQSEAIMFDFYMTSAAGIAILGYKACTELDLV